MTPQEKMAKLLAQSIAQELPAKPEWFANAKHESGMPNQGAEAEWRDECEAFIFTELAPMLSMVAASAPQAQQQMQLEEPQGPTGKSGESMALTGCRRGWSHRKGHTCPLCGDQGENLLPGGRFDPQAQQSKNSG